MLNTATMERQAQRLHANAKDGSAVVDGVRYALTFDRYEGIYSVTDPEGSEIVRFNTRKVTQARTWLREYLA